MAKSLKTRSIHATYGRVLKGKDDSVFSRVTAGRAALTGLCVTSESQRLHGWCSPCLCQPSQGMSATYPLLLSCSTAFPGMQHLCLPCGLGLARAAPAAHSHCASLQCSHVLGAVHSCSNKHTRERNKSLPEKNKPHGKEQARGRRANWLTK